MSIIRFLAAALLIAAPALAQTAPPAATPQAPPPQPAPVPNPSNDPFPTPIATTDGVIKVQAIEFASLPDVGTDAARIMHFVDEPGSKRYFVSDMRGILYTVSYDGKTVAPYLDLRDPKWTVSPQAQGSERGFQSFAFHPQFTRRGAPGFGKFYTYIDITDMTKPADFKPGGGNHTHDLVLLEWTAKTPTATAYDGDAAREMIRWEQPFANHNGGHITFNTLARERDADFGLLYVGVADGGSGGDPLKLAQNLNSGFGKIFRIDPLGKNSKNGNYGFPASNPFASDKNDDTLGEIYAYGVRNPQRLFWDSKTNRMYMSDIGQNIVEEISPVTIGANLGWNVWEGSFLYGGRTGVSLDNQRSDPKVTYPIAEYGQLDPLLQGNSAAIGGFVYRDKAIKQLTDLLIFGDNPSGEIFYISADKLPPNGGQDAIRRVLFDDNGETKTLLQLVQDKNVKQGKTKATRVDLRFGLGPNGQIFLLNKRDGTIRQVVPDGSRPTTKSAR